MYNTSSEMTIRLTNLLEIFLAATAQVELQ